MLLFCVYDVQILVVVSCCVSSVLILDDVWVLLGWFASTLAFGFWGGCCPCFCVSGLYGLPFWWVC